MKRVAAVFLATGFMLTCPVRAQDEDPGRGVARISVINGDVSIRRGDSGDFIAAAINAPLVVQDHLATGGNSRAEVQFDWANMLRLNSDSEVRFAELANKRYQVQLSTGTVTFRVLRDSDADVEVNTPSVSVRPVKKGVYRISVLQNGDSEITVRSGEAEIYSPRGVERLRSGRTMLARGSATDPEFQIVDAIPQDDWDRWNDRRDHDLDRSRSYQYVSRDIYGADDLDSYGRWIYVPAYGWVWSPNGAGPGWAPYRAGRWAWVDWYGWTWVSYEPWGWAPYHYGRWFYQGPYGWCWFPGAIHTRHYWAPGLVAFFGWGSGVHVGIGFGNVGWVPLAPYETYHPWYGRRYYGGFRNQTVVVNNVVVNNVNVTNVYRNARWNGITGLRGEEFARGGAGRGMRASDIPVREASLVRGPVPVTPGRESLRLTNREVANVPRAAGVGDRFYSRRQPAAVERIPFEQQRAGMDRMVRSSFGGPQREAAAATPGAAPDRGQGGWRRMSETPATARQAEAGTPRTTREGIGRFGGTQPEARSEAPARSGDTGNWRRFEGRGRDTAAPAGTPAARPAETRPADSGNWRRSEGRGRDSAGTPEAPAARPAEARPAETRPADSGGNWRRFEGRGRDSAGTPEAPAARPSEARPAETRPADSGGNWRRFEGRGRDSAGAPETPAARPAESRPGPGAARSESRSEAPRYMPSPRSEQIHINPPIVRERAAPQASGGGWNRGGGGGGSVRMSAPESRGGGGGGGGARMSAPESRGGGGGGRGESRGGGRR